MVFDISLPEGLFHVAKYESYCSLLRCSLQGILAGLFIVRDRGNPSEMHNNAGGTTEAGHREGDISLFCG